MSPSYHRCTALRRLALRSAPPSALLCTACHHGCRWCGATHGWCSSAPACPRQTGAAAASPLRRATYYYLLWPHSLYLLYLLSLSRRATSCPLWAKARSRCYTIARPARRTTRRAASSSRETTSSSATRAVIAPQTASTGWWAAACAHSCRSSRRSAGGGACAPLMACGQAPLCASTRATSCSTRTPRPRASRWTPTS